VRTLATFTVALLVTTANLAMAESMQMPMKASTAASTVAAMPLVNG
jgi:hypothetical protein